MRNRTELGAVLAAMLVGAAWGQDNPDIVRQARQGAVTKAQTAMAASAIPKAQPIALLRIVGETSGGDVRGLVKNAMTAAGLTVVEVDKEDPVSAAIEAEQVKISIRGDIFDPKTLVKFNNLKYARLLMYGYVRAARDTGRSVYVEIELHVSSVETGQHIWGGTFAHRIPVPDEYVKPVDKPLEARRAIQAAVSNAAAALAQSGRLKSNLQILHVPLSQETDSYSGHEVKGLFQMAGVPAQIVELDVRTLGQARQIMRDDPKRADGVLYGMLVDWHRYVPADAITARGTTNIYRAEIQLSVQTRSPSEPDTYVIAWSTSAHGEYRHFEPRPNLWERMKIWMQDQVLESKGGLVKWVAIGIGAVVLLLFIYKIFGPKPPR